MKLCGTTTNTVEVKLIKNLDPTEYNQLQGARSTSPTCHLNVEVSPIFIRRHSLLPLQAKIMKELIRFVGFVAVLTVLGAEHRLTISER